MSDAVKWAILVSVMVALIVTVLTFPFVQYIDFGVVEQSFAILSSIGSFFRKARMAINILFFPQARLVLNGLIDYFFLSRFFKLAVKITAWIGHFIFK